jgi:hypothetical protein
MEPIPDCLVSTFKEDWAPVLRKIIEEDKGEPHLVSIGDIFSHDTASEFRRDTEGTLRPVLLRDTVRKHPQHDKGGSPRCELDDVSPKHLRGLSGRGWSEQGSTWASQCTLRSGTVGTSGVHEVDSASTVSVENSVPVIPRRLGSGQGGNRRLDTVSKPRIRLGHPGGTSRH